jgi:hypothetical protein
MTQKRGHTLNATRNDSSRKNTFQFHLTQAGFYSIIEGGETDGQRKTSAEGQRRGAAFMCRANNREAMGTLWHPALREVPACGALSARRFAESY